VIDLGTASTVVWAKDRGVLVNQPSVIALNQRTGRVLAVGSAAKQMIGRTPGQVSTARPLLRGVVADAPLAVTMLRRLLGGEWQWRLRKPQVVVAVPAGVTEVERRAVAEVLRTAGARRVKTVQASLAAALGMGLDIGEPAASMVIDIGGGTTEAAIISLGGLVTSRLVKVGGDDLDQAIISHVREAYGLVLGETTAEQVKIAAASAYPDGADRRTSIRGLDRTTLQPRVVDLTAGELHAAMAVPLHAIIGTVVNTLAACPPELAADLVHRGIVLTGGGARLHGLDRRLGEETGIPIHLPDEPLHPIVHGAARLAAGPIAQDPLACIA